MEKHSKRCQPRAALAALKPACRVPSGDKALITAAPTRTEGRDEKTVVRIEQRVNVVLSLSFVNRLEAVSRCRATDQVKNIGRDG